jgi:hypothetical protein
VQPQIKVRLVKIVTAFLFTVLKELFMYAATSPFAEKLTTENAALVLVDHQTGLFQFLPSVEPMKLRHNVIALGEMVSGFRYPPF